MFPSHCVINTISHQNELHLTILDNSNHGATILHVINHGQPHLNSILLVFVVIVVIVVNVVNVVNVVIITGAWHCYCLP